MTLQSGVRSLFVVVSFVAILATQANAATITQWSFENPPNAVAVNNSPAPTTGTGTASSIGMNVYATPNIGVTTDDVVVGKAADTGANGNADLTQTWRVRGQAGASGAANGWSSQAPIATQGAVFAATTAGFGSITVSFDWYATTQGEANLQLQYTTDGSTWINTPITLNALDTGLVVATNALSPNTVVGSYVSDNLLNNGAPAGQNWFPGLSAAISDPLAVNDPNFAIRMVNASTGVDNVSTAGTALNNTSGNWRFDNVSISGTPVPEPSSVVLAVLGLVGAGFYGVRRRNRDGQ